MGRALYGIILTMAAACLWLLAACGDEQSNGGDDVLVRNDLYAVYPDSVVEGNTIAVAHDANELTSNYGGKRLVWKRAGKPSGLFVYTSEQPLADAVYNMSMEQVENFLATGATGDSRLLNHERCYYIDLALAMIAPERSKQILRQMTENGCIAGADQSPMLGGHHIWAEAAWQVYLATGDKSWLKEAHQIILNTLKKEEFIDLSGDKKLVHGSAPFLSVEAYYPQWMDERDLISTYSLDENLMVCRTYTVLYEMGDELGLINEYNRTADHLKDVVNSALWNETHSSYSQYTYGSIYQAQSPRCDNLGQALSVLWNIADDNRAETLIEDTPITHYGVTAIYPCVVDSFQHLGTLSMPLLQAYWNMAAAKVSNTNMLRRGFGVMLRAQALAASCNVTVDATTGDIDIGGRYATANAVANLAMALRVVAGIRLLPGGFELAPCVPQGYKGTKLLKNFKYRNASYDISIKGCGNDFKSISLDGKQQEINFIDADITGHHTIEIVMNEIDADAGKVTIALPEKVLPNPPEVAWDGNNATITNYVPGEEYRVTIDGEKAFTTTDSTFTIDAGTDVARVISVTAVNKWGESFGGVPYYIKPHEIVVDPSSAIIHEQDSAHYLITTNVPEAGNYLMWINYIAQERSAARLVSINTHLQGMAVMPRREKVHSLPNVISDSAVDIIESNVINVLLLKGKNTISLEAPDDNITLPHYRNKVKIFNIILVKK